jgi:hypothetical protein
MRLRPRIRQGRCYELSYRFLLWDDRFATSWDLVLREIISPIGDGKPIGYAWLIRDQGVFDSNSDTERSWNNYSAKYKAKPFVRYSRTQAIALGTRLGHYGPWDEWVDVTHLGPKCKGRGVAKV